jgi:hypothetical protein
MQCPDEEILFLYANGEEIDEEKKAEIEQHLLECDSCQKEYNSYRSMKQLLVESWDGKIEGCFDSNTLAEYLEGWVDDAVKRRVETHLSDCEVCASELEMMRQIEIQPPEVDIEIPVELDEKILGAIMSRREEILNTLPLSELIKKNPAEAAKRLTERYIAAYHQAEQSLVESFWEMLAPLYNRDVHFGATEDIAGGWATGDARDARTPSVIFSMMGVCDSLQELDEIPEKTQLRKIIRQNAKRFDVSWWERRKLQRFLDQELTDD